MKVVCEKYKEEMEAEEALCRHPGEYCKFRTACLVHFLSREKKPAAGKKPAEPNQRGGE